VAGLWCIMMGGCAASGSYGAADGARGAADGARGAADGARGAATYTVRPEDTLYSIAWRHNLDWRELAKWNHIDGDYKLTIGQVLRLSPVAPQSAQAARKPPSLQSGRTAQPSASSGPPSRQAAAAAPGVTSSGAGAVVAPFIGDHLKWVWPTDRLSPPRPVPGGGILLLGRLGQDIRAAGSGRVVYSGNGLRGYGNLIIIKHGENLLSSYAHNREMLVHEGQEVAAGQVIAHMGTGAHQTSALYFEIRVNGKPTDPLRYLATAK
jgi:lipoprotein NlpD